MTINRPELESHVALRDGSVAHIRLIRATDEPHLLELLRGLSDDDRRLRTLVELLKDISVRLSPLTGSDAASMLRELRSFPLLEGYRGGPKCDVAALEDVLLRISALAEDHPRIAEMDCNPVIVSAAGAIVVDVRVRIAPAAPRRPLGARR